MADGWSSLRNGQAGARSLYWQAADGTGAVERLSESPNQQYATALSPDGRRLIFTDLAPKTREDVMQMALDGTHRVTPLVQSPPIALSIARLVRVWRYALPPCSTSERPPCR
jgi:hypothetical protein